MIKILHLVLYSDDEYYNQMYDILNNFYKHYENNDNGKQFFVKTYFYRYNNTIINNIEIIDNIIHIKGKESGVPGVMEKTLSTFKYIQKEFQVNNYDYIVRSNISTIIDFKLLVKELEITPVEYYGGFINGKLGNTYDDFLSDNSIIPFVIGYNIILSTKGFNLLLNNINLIDKTVIDDIAIGIIFNKLNINITTLLIEKVILVPHYNINDTTKLISFKKIIYRNKNDNRYIDVMQMNAICNLLLEKK